MVSRTHRTVREQTKSTDQPCVCLSSLDIVAEEGGGGALRGWFWRHLDHDHDHDDLEEEQEQEDNKGEAGLRPTSEVRRDQSA